jgi:hypothetical protein
MVAHSCLYISVIFSLEIHKHLIIQQIQTVKLFDARVDLRVAYANSGIHTYLKIMEYIFKYFLLSDPEMWVIIFWM